MPLGEPSDREQRGSPSPALSRRGFLQAGSMLAAGAAAGWPVTGRARPVAGAPAAGRAGPIARNFIFMVADGMSNGALALADMHSRYLTGRPLNWISLLKTPDARRVLQSTHCADSAVTDSAAASSAWSTGVKHDMASLCVTPQNRRPTPVLIRAKATGRLAGCVTTTTITHATPAGFYANVSKRGDEAMVGSQLLEREPDVALGGGARFFSKDPSDGSPGLSVVRSRADLASLALRPERPARVLGLFNSSHIAMKLDRSENEPSLVEMARFALAYLSSGSPGFVLQIEGGRVDHGAHANDAAGMLHDLIEFDQTLAEVAAFVRSRNDTTLIVTTDHATANPGLTFYGKAGIAGLRTLSEATHSFEWIFDRAAVIKDVDARTAEIVRLVKQALGIDLPADAAPYLAASLRAQRTDPFMPSNTTTCVLGSLVGNAVGVSFVSPDHTADLTEALVLGVGATDVPAYMDNTEIAEWMFRMLDLPPDPLA